MSQIQIVLQISLSIISLLQLLLAGFALLLDPRNRCNRYLAAHLTLLSVIAFSSSRLSAATDVSQASVWFHILGAATVAVGPALLIVTLSLLRPDDWQLTRIERGVWRLAHILLALPIALVLGDAVFDTNWFVTGLDPQTYAGGFAATNAYARGSLARLLIPINLYLLSSAPLLLIVYTLWRRRPSSPVIQARARWLLVAQLGMMIVQLGTLGRVNNLATTTLTDVVVVIVYTALILRGLVSDAALTQALANVRLLPKLSISVGAALLGLMLISAITIYANVSLQNQVTETLNRQQELADLTASTNVTLLDIQNRASRFYDAWTVDGFEDATTGGFLEARRVHLDPLQKALLQVRDLSTQLAELEPDDDTLADVTRIANSVDEFERTVLQMSDQMESLGHQSTGSLGRLNAYKQELGELVGDLNLVPLSASLLEMGQVEQSFFSRSDAAAAQQTVRLNNQLQQQVAAADVSDIPLGDKTRLIYLLGRYQDEFSAATDVHLALQASRANLVERSDATASLVNTLLVKQQAKLGAAVESFEARRTSSVITVIGLALLTLFTSATAAYFVAGKVILPLRELGQTADLLGAGDLTVRAVVHGQDEIGTTASAFNVMADRLGDLLAGLEQEVADRTRDLTRRTGYLEASVEVGRAASSILETDELLRQVVELIRNQFDLYYVGLFLLDSDREWAVLRAGTGSAGHAMMARGHRIPIGQGMIGWSIANAAARVASDASGDVVRLATQELPDTRSEAAVPLRSRSQVLGALSVQATRPDAFDETAVSALQSMADQVAVALDNARLYSASQEALETARRAYGELGRAHWADLIRHRAKLGYRTDERGTAPIAPDAPWSKEMLRVVDSGSVASGEALSGEQSGTTVGGDRHPLVIPIRAHGQVIGVIDTYKPGDNGGWTTDEIEMIRNITSQLALALDNARLHQETQMRVLREKLAAEIAARLRETLEVEAVLRTAVDDIYDALDLDELSIILEPDSGAENADIATSSGPSRNGGRDA
jgi:GAF domain-containing protein/HAMP domain-containing protein